MTANRKKTKADIESAEDMGYALEELETFLSLTNYESPPTLIEPQIDYEYITKIVEKIRKSLKVEFFLWIDAAFNGLVEPFLNSNFTPFKNAQIQTFSTDFHKYGFVPMPSGLILYRKSLRKLIERPIDYLKEKDNTLLGSRSGISPVGCWNVINALGKVGFKKIIIEESNNGG